MMSMLFLISMAFSACINPTPIDTDTITEKSPVPIDVELEAMHDDEAVKNSYDYIRKYSSLAAFEKEGACMDVYTIIDQSNPSYSTELIKDPKFRKNFEKIYNSPDSADALVAALNNLVMEQGFRYIFATCSTDTSTYFTFSTDTTDIYIVKWTDDGSFIISEQIEGVNDIFYTFTPEAMDFDHLVRTGYGDAGAIWWEYHGVNVLTGKVELLEKCTLKQQYDENTGDFTDAFDLNCEKKFEA